MTWFVIALAIWLVIATAPRTPIGGWLRRCLVERLAARLSRITAGQLGLIAVVIVSGLFAAWLGGGDGVGMIGMALPDIATWLASAELTAYLDIVVSAVAAWSILRTQKLGERIWAAFAASRRREARPRAPRSSWRSAPAGDNDNGEPSRLAV